MDFALSEEQEAFQETARRFAEERLAPAYQERERARRIDRSLVAEMGALGLVAPDLPEAFGGLAAGGLATGLVAEQVAYGDISVSYVCLLGSLTGNIIAASAPRRSPPNGCRGWSRARSSSASA